MGPKSVQWIYCGQVISELNVNRSWPNTFWLPGVNNTWMQLCSHFLFGAPGKPNMVSVCQWFRSVLHSLKIFVGDRLVVHCVSHGEIITTRGSMITCFSCDPIRWSPVSKWDKRLLQKFKIYWGGIYTNMHHLHI